MKSFPIVAIGASAGGLEAIAEFLKNLDPQTGMAYVYIQHLDPTHKSLLSSILARYTKMEVLEARNLMRIQPDHLYIIPPDKDMDAIDGVLKLNPRSARTLTHMPIDQFFISAAEKHEHTTIGVILSGNANDGTLGLKAIKMAGGITFAQDDSARFQSMPRSAIAEGVVDFVLPPAGIARELSLFKPGNPKANLLFLPPDPTQRLATDESLDNIIRLVKKGTGVDFAHYKMNTVRRRIIRRMLLFKLETLGDYFQYLRTHASEMTALYQDLLINVTSFFRDSDVMEYLKKAIIPKLVKNKSPENPIRVWVPACASGEEAYSLAIFFSEVLGDASGSLLQIFATDLSETAISKARVGLYGKNDLENVNPKRLQRFFTKTEGGYRIVKSIRDSCVFATHNLFRDPPFSRLDLISCCNLLIYLDDVLQKKVLAIYHYALNNTGYLVLGRSETISDSPQLFSQIEKKFKIYSRKSDASGKAFFDMAYRPRDREPARSSREGIPDREKKGQAVELEKAIDHLLLNQFAPPSMVVNQDLEIIQFRGSINLLLEPSPGKASLNLMKMAPQGLALELRNLVRKSQKTGVNTKKTGLIVKNKGVIHHVAAESIPLPTDTEEKLFLIVFSESGEGTLPRQPSVLKKDEFVKQLQAELISLREDLRTLVEEKDASVEELQSANEEILSSNEELQSINEELETAKEEVESTNEELMTINSELQVRNEQLSESYAYAETVFDTIQEAVILLDRDLKVQWANKAYYNMFKVKAEGVEGVPFFEIGGGQWNIPTLREIIESTIPGNTMFRGFEVHQGFPQIGERFILINGRKIIQKTHRQQLVLLAMEDITDHRKAENIIAEREAWFRNVADNAPIMIWVVNQDKKPVFFNRAWLDFKGHDLDWEKGIPLGVDVFREDYASYIATFNQSFDARQPFTLEFRMKRFDGLFRWVQETSKPTYSAEGEFTGFIGSCSEIHNEKMVQEELEAEVVRRTKDYQAANKELERSNKELEEFAYVASHDLQEPLRKIISFSDRLDPFTELLPEKGQAYIGKIAGSSQRMTRLIDDLLNYSKISRARKVFVRTDLDQIVKGMIGDFDVTISQSNGRFSLAHLPTIDSIPIQMEQLFHNLISNSLKFTRPDVPPVISIACQMVEENAAQPEEKLKYPGGFCHIAVSDNGIGFNPEFAEQIFTIFQRLNNRREYPGTGIGLALCRKIVENHHGEIFAESSPDCGATFHVVLPLRQS